MREQKGVYERLGPELKQLDNSSAGEERDREFYTKRQDLYERRVQAAAISVTVAGMCLEAFFYDYAVDHLGKGCADDLDKLNLCGKLVVIPRIVTGKEIKKSSDVYRSAKQLAQDRNYLVHFKSKAFGPNALGKVSEFFKNLDQRLESGTENGIKAIELVMKKLDRLHNSKHQEYFRSLCGS